MEIEWLGHASVLLRRRPPACLQRILFDPYEPGGFAGRVAYSPIDEPVDIVILTHHHADHSHVGPALGTPAIVDRSRRLEDVTVTMTPAWHDREEGARMGLVRVASLEVDGLRVVHLGDLGAPLDETQRRRVGRPDVLLLPVGGTFTLDAVAAAETAARLHPTLIVPIHYRTSRCTLPIAPVTPFLAEARRRGWPVFENVGAVVSLPLETLPSAPSVLVLTPSH